MSVFLPVACVPTSGVLGVRPWRAMTLTVYSVPGRRPLSTTLSWSPLGAGRTSLSPSSELEYRMRYDVTVPSGLSQVMRMVVESMSEKLRSLGRSIAAGKRKEEECINFSAKQLFLPLLGLWIDLKRTLNLIIKACTLTSTNYPPVCQNEQQTWTVNNLNWIMNRCFTNTLKTTA